MSRACRASSGMLLPPAARATTRNRPGLVGDDLQRLGADGAGAAQDHHVAHRASVAGPPRPRVNGRATISAVESGPAATRTGEPGRATAGPRTGRHGPPRSSESPTDLRHQLERPRPGPGQEGVADRQQAERVAALAAPSRRQPEQLGFPAQVLGQLGIADRSGRGQRDGAGAGRDAEQQRAGVDVAGTVVPRGNSRTPTSPASRTTNAPPERPPRRRIDTAVQRSADGRPERLDDRLRGAPRSLQRPAVGVDPVRQQAGGRVDAGQPSPPCPDRVQPGGPVEQHGRVGERARGDHRVARPVLSGVALQEPAAAAAQRGLDHRGPAAYVVGVGRRLRWPGRGPRRRPAPSRPGRCRARAPCPSRRRPPTPAGPGCPAAPAPRRDPPTACAPRPSPSGPAGSSRPRGTAAASGLRRRRRSPAAGTSCSAAPPRPAAGRSPTQAIRRATARPSTPAPPAGRPAGGAARRKRRCSGAVVVGRRGEPGHPSAQHAAGGGGVRRRDRSLPGGD